jgi:hypothetical protein
MSGLVGRDKGVIEAEAISTKTSTRDQGMSRRETGEELCIELQIGIGIDDSAGGNWFASGRVADREEVWANCEAGQKLAVPSREGG